MELAKKSLEVWIIEAGFSQRSFAERAGVSDTLINLIISGKRKNVRPDTRRKIAEALNIQMRQITEFDAMIEEQLGKDVPVIALVSSTGTPQIAAGAITALSPPLHYSLSPL